MQLLDQDEAARVRVSVRIRVRVSLGAVGECHWASIGGPVIVTCVVVRVRKL